MKHEQLLEVSKETYEELAKSRWVENENDPKTIRIINEN